MELSWREHAWPGNVRELRNVIRQALLQLTGPATLEAESVSRLLKKAPARPSPTAPALDAGLTLRQIDAKPPWPKPSKRLSARPCACRRGNILRRRRGL